MKLRSSCRALSLAVLLALCSTAGAEAQVTAIRAGKLLDPETGTVAVNQVILVEGDTIKAIGADLRIPAGATVINLSNQTVLPGLFDAHTHLCMTTRRERDGGRYYFTTLIDSNAYRAIQGVANARSMLETGFTTVRDVGNAGNYVDSDLRRSINEGLVPGPTIINAGRIIAPYGGQFQMQPDKRDLGNPEYFYADTRDELKKAVRENIHYGARVIKLVVDDQRYIYSVEDIRFVIEEARLAGLKVAAHCWTDQGARNAAEAGVASIEHGVAMSNETLAIAKRNNVALVPTPFTETDARTFQAPGANKEINERWFIDPVKRAHQAGVTLVFGPDVIFTTPEYSRGRLSIETIDNWVEAGIPPRVILQALTTNAARLLGVEKSRGALRAGMKADIIATGDNPLDQIGTLKSVTFVMKNGKVFKQGK
ncbi:MAG TPA: amidohydrolase family protein [Pyrinomonadaceae bacterium]|nr:amidohydrolase family protein [Pyrinomonadaceae bacterium]